MDPIERWKLAEELNVYQISLLLTGYDPAKFTVDKYEDWPIEIKKEIATFLTSVRHAVYNDKIKSTIERNGDYGDANINLEFTTISIVSLRQWLEDRNYRDGYFISSELTFDKVADPSGEFYAPKLAAALRAWREVTADPEAAKGKSPKKALEVWLRKHADEYGLAGKDGNPNELGIEEICKVANWRPAGGATPAPVPVLSRPHLPIPQGGDPTRTRKVRPNSPTPRPISPNRRPTLGLTNMDDDIPF
jgi:hypothetical protein